MKKLSFLLILVLFLFGCEKFDQPSEPNLTGKPWVFTDYYITVVSSISPVEIVYNDTICINAFGEQSYVSGDALMEQHYGLTLNDRRFIKGKTTWEFDDSNYTLYINGNTDKRYPVVYPSYMRTERTQMRVSNPDYGAETNFTFFTDAMGMNYPLKLTLVSPSIVSDLLLSNGMRDKAVTVQVTLIFTRN
jgi:hypothetical protein